MDTSFVAASLFDNENLNSIWLMLGWTFLIAAFVWLIVWLLFWGDDDAADTESSSSSSSSRSAKSAPAKAAAPKAAKVSGDDFTALGLAGGTQDALYADKVTKYGQIADWSDDDVSSYSSRFGKDNKGVDFAELPWKANALAGGIDLSSVSSDDPAFGAPHKAPAKVNHAKVIKSDFAGEDVKNDKDLGIVYAKGAAASHEDDLSEIKGVGPKLSKELNVYGVFCFKQIANWSDHNVAEFSERLNCFKNRIERDRWIPQAAATECEGNLEDFEASSEEAAAGKFADELASGDVKQDSVYGIVYTKKPADIDDLKKIKGIGKVFEGKLHDIGIYRFKQVAVWTKSACEEFSKMLTFKDRIYRDNWLAQAKDFHEKKYDDKL